MSDRATRQLAICSALLTTLVGLVGCANSLNDGRESETACDEARAHLQSCFPDREVDVPESCSRERARDITSKSCSELEANSTAAKADDYCDPWMDWTCDDEEENEDREEDGFGEDHDVWLHTKSCSTSACATVRAGPECAKLALENADGEVVRTTYTEERGNVRVTDLAEGTYTMKLYRRDGSLGEDIEGEPAETTFEVGDGEPGVAPSITVEGDGIASEGSVGEYVRCTKGRIFVESTCDGEPMTTEETEWSWIVELRGEDESGDAREYTRPFEIRGENQFVFTRMYVGEYDLVFHEVEVPDWDRENNLEQSDYRDLVEDHGTGRTVEKPVDIEASDVTPTDEETEVGRYDLDHRECR